MASAPKLLTEPFLQLPTKTSVVIVWFTEFAGDGHLVAYGENLQKTVFARTTKLPRIREDSQSRVANQTLDGEVYKEPVMRHIWRHEVELTGLTPDTRICYRVTSVREDSESVSSRIFTLIPNPPPNTPLKILLTSDHQLKPMVAANLQKAVETVGKIDLVLFAGDLVNVSDRASEWFDDNRGGAFFPCLQGRAKYEMEKNGVKTIYTGGEILQSAPMYTCIGNHEIMGRVSKGSINEEFDDPIPRAVAKELYGESDEKSLKENSFNTGTYEHIFTLPQSQEGGKTYYAVTYGDLRLVVLYATNMWRHFRTDEGSKGKYAEPEADLNNPENWGYGQHIYEPISKGSTQYNWLEEELNSPEFQQAKYKVVMLHHPPHSLGGNVVPAYTDPVQIIERDGNSQIIGIRYEYPKNQDYLIRDVVPLLETYCVQLVFYGHSHLWNRFCSPSGMHFLETSNVGNSYGAAWNNNKREVPIAYPENYAQLGNPNGLEPIVPTIAPLLDASGNPMPYIASNDITVFSIFETATGTITSYRFDTSQPELTVVKFDEFKLRNVDS
jgi:Calcineurin-like phosphoesterase/Purple acid Phosphatase, N-terminal domain